MDINITVTPQNTINFPIHSHNTWELMSYTSGVGDLCMENEKLPFKTGTVIAIPPGVMHGSQSENFFSNICIHVNVEMNENRVYYLFDGTEQQISLFNIIKNIYFDKANSFVLANLILALKDLICVEIETDISPIETVYRKITQNYYNYIDIPGLINESGYVDDFFRTLFKNKYGITPRQLLEKCRLEYACQLISTYKRSLKVSDISKLCGFDDALYFSRRFKKMFNVSPQEYIEGKMNDERN